MTMSQSKVGDLLVSQGMRRHKIGRMPVFWTGRETEVAPFFSPALIRRRGGNQLLGVVGVMIFPFEKWWAEKLQQFPPDAGAWDGFLLSVYVTNFEELMDPPFINGTDGDRWVSDILSKMQELPASVTSLEQMNQVGSMAGLAFARFRGHPVKVAAAEKWFGENDWPTLFPNANRVSDPAPYTAAYSALF